MQKAVTSNNTSLLAWPPYNLNKIDDKYKCPMCKQIMLNAHQADDCGCRFCFECLDEM